MCVSAGVSPGTRSWSQRSKRKFKGVFAQPAAGNAGTALGAALHAWHGVAEQTQRLDAGSYYLGPDFTVQQEIRSA